MDRHERAPFFYRYSIKTCPFRRTAEIAEEDAKKPAVEVIAVEIAGATAAAVEIAAIEIAATGIAATEMSGVEINSVYKQL